MKLNVDYLLFVAVESREYQRGWGQALIQLAGFEFQYYQQRVAIGQPLSDFFLVGTVGAAITLTAIIMSMSLPLPLSVLLEKHG